MNSDAPLADRLVDPKRPELDIVGIRRTRRQLIVTVIIGVLAICGARQLGPGAAAAPVLFGLNNEQCLAIANGLFFVCWLLQPFLVGALVRTCGGPFLASLWFALLTLVPFVGWIVAGVMCLVVSGHLEVANNATVTRPGA